MYSMINDITFIMYYTIYPKRGGLHEQVYLLSREFRRMGIKVRLAYYIHELLNGGKRLRIPLALSGLHPKLWSRISEPAIIETAWPGLASVPLTLGGKEHFFLHLHSIESLPYSGLPTYQRFTVKALELIAGSLCKKIISVSLEEYEILRKRFGAKVAYVPLAIDVEERERYIKMKDFCREKIGIGKEKLVVTFVGGMRYGPNRESAMIIARQIMPKVREKLGSKVLFMMVGSDPPPELRKLEGLMLTGYVNDVSPYIAASDLCIAPVYKGGGVKMKVLDCMSLKKPVIATNHAVKGTRLKPLKHYIPANSVDEFVDEILQFASSMNRDEYEEISEEGYRYVVNHHSASSVAKKFLSVIEYG
ncbi:MAG: glycosyltransferase family 4 protein [Candidatus Nezhaarchaeales archaeon]